MASIVYLFILLSGGILGLFIKHPLPHSRDHIPGLCSFFCLEEELRA